MMNVVINFEQRGIVRMTPTNVETAISEESPLNHDEMAFIAGVHALYSQMQNRRFVSHDFNIKDYQNLDEVVRCEWLPRTLNLKVHGPTDKHWHFCKTVEEAVKERRSFSCTRRTALELPPSRPRDSHEQEVTTNLSEAGTGDPLGSDSVIQGDGIGDLHALGIPKPAIEQAVDGGKG